LLSYIKLVKPKYPDFKMKIATINKISGWESKPLNRDILSLKLALKDLIITGFVFFIS
jgi:hypothetical protein